MKHKIALHLFLLVLIWLLWALPVQAQLWSSVLNSQRAIDWSSSAGVPGGVPNRTVVCTTLNPGATAAQINSAISACGTNQVVFLNAGTYNLTAKILIARNDVVLRGAGAAQTKLVFSGSSTCGDGIVNCVIDLARTGLWSGGTQNLTTWLGAGNPPVSGTYTKGATQILVGSNTNMSNGKYLILDQAEDTTDPGDIYMCGELTATCSSEGSAGGGGRCDIAGCSSSSDDNGQMQFVKITGISGTTITVGSPIYMPNWRTSQSPHAWWTTSPQTNVGVEDLTADARATTATAVISFNATHESWVKGVAAYKVNGSRNGISIHYSSKDTIRDSYVLGTPGNNLSYGVETWMSGDILVENTIFHKGVTAILFGAGCGNVFAYNFFVDQQAANTGWLFGASDGHDPGRCMTLYEGNDTWNMVEDAIHGSGAMLTYFRNRSRGSDNTDQTLGVQTSQTVPFILQSFNRYLNLVGNVEGRGGYHTQYQSISTGSSTNCNFSIYNIGWGSTSCGNGTVNPDTPTITSMMRWGNYDVVTGVPRWCGNSSNTGWSTTCASTSEVPTGAPVYPNAVPATETLPNSFYLSAQPTTWWTTPWGTPHWPPIGPDVTGGNISEGTGGEAGLDGHAYKIPARLCFENTSQTSGVLNFNAASCYTSSSDTTPPAAPTGVRVD